ncbi:MAG: hypothetical protein EA353_13015, partial [Puniceicoccaceae bacterium]
MNEQNLPVWILAGGGIILAALGVIFGTYREFKSKKTKAAKKRYCFLVLAYALTLGSYLWLSFKGSIEVSILSSLA